MAQTVFKRPESLTGVDYTYCPGCGHGIITTAVAKAIDELGILDESIHVSSVGCGGLTPMFFNSDTIIPMHGRSPATATGIKRIHPDKIVWTYQGDGDLASIGTAEIVHAAHRGERITTIFVNNTTYGMTGGQMAPTTLIGQKTTTCVDGRTIEQAGMPMRMCELISCQDRAVYVERVSLDSPANVRKAKSAIRRAFKVQDLKLGFAFVEFLSICPTNWGLTAPKAMEWLRENMMPYYPVKQFKCPEEVKEVK